MAQDGTGGVYHGIIESLARRQPQPTGDRGNAWWVRSRRSGN